MAPGDDCRPGRREHGRGTLVRGPEVRRCVRDLAAGVEPVSAVRIGPEQPGSVDNRRDVHDAGGRIEPTDGLGDPPGHCNVYGLTARQLDTILSEPELNPVPRELRWRGTPA